jgi:hypothetical protein
LISIIAISKAAPVISDVSTNFDKMLKLNDFTTKHKRIFVGYIFVQLNLT